MVWQFGQIHRGVVAVAVCVQYGDSVVLLRRQGDDIFIWTGNCVAVQDCICNWFLPRVLCRHVGDLVYLVRGRGADGNAKSYWIADIAQGIEGGDEEIKKIM